MFCGRGLPREVEAWWVSLQMMDDDDGPAGAQLTVRAQHSAEPSTGTRTSTRTKIVFLLCEQRTVRHE